MRAVIQRANTASVSIEDKVVGEIKHGLVVLLGVTHDDTKTDVDYLVNKIAHLRIFEDTEQKMNLSLLDCGGSILSISQFTLYADTRKGRRPNFMDAAVPDHAKALYDYFNEQLQALDIQVETGVFGQMMDVTLTNTGPVTIILDSQDK